MIGPGDAARPEVIDIAAAAEPPEGAAARPFFRSLVRPADQRMIAKLSGIMDPSDVAPGTVWGDLMVGDGVQLPVALDQFSKWWAEHVGTNAYAGSARPVLLAHDAFTVRQRLRDYIPLVEELFSNTLDVSSIQAMTGGTATAWDPTHRWPSARDAVLDAWQVYESTARAIHADA